MVGVKALNWLEQARQQAVVSVEKLAGQTACSHLVQLENGERYVLRLQTARATDFGIDYQREARLLNQISPLHFSPVPYYCDENATLLSWIEGQMPTVFCGDLLKKLAEKLAILHQFAGQGVTSSPFLTCENAPIKPFNLAEHCTFLWHKLPPEKRVNLPFSPPFSEITPWALAICHHDLHLANLIVQGDKLFLIDWEYASLSDPTLELAMFLHNNALTNVQQQIFLQHYFAKSGRDPTACLAKMAEYQPLISVLNQLWYAF